jgi:hypothetical protein
VPFARVSNSSADKLRCGNRHASSICTLNRSDAGSGIKTKTVPTAYPRVYSCIAIFGGTWNSHPCGCSVGCGVPQRPVPTYALPVPRGQPRLRGAATFSWTCLVGPALDCAPCRGVRQIIWIFLQMLEQIWLPLGPSSHSSSASTILSPQRGGSVQSGMQVP